MATFKIFKLTFTSPLHLSRGKMNTYESSDITLHSDTLKSAIYVAALQLDMKLWADDFMENMTISSAFPFDAKGCYLPMPLSYYPEVKTDERKAFKSVKFLTIKQFEAIAKGETTDVLDAERKANQPKIWERDTTQRVKINLEGDSEPFYVEKLYPEKGSGLYFMAQSESVDFTKLRAALRLLQDNGIGLQKGLGNGQFTFEEETLQIDLASNANAWLNLSLYRPIASELTDTMLKKSSYQFKKRGGWIASPAQEDNISLRKKAVLMFTEGSVFSFENIDNQAIVKGKVENIKPDTNQIEHPIWRDGKAIFLPITIAK